MAKDLDIEGMKNWVSDTEKHEDNSIYSVIQSAQFILYFSCMETGMLNVGLTKKYRTIYDTLSS